MSIHKGSFLDLQLFQDEKHEPFRLNGGRPAAVLIHGFPGTPAEMRPIGNLLHNNGWTAEGILLPGFGAQLNTIFSYDYQDWIEASLATIERVRKEYAPVLLIGYSMGGSVALNVSSKIPPDGLILLAPFWQFNSLSQHLLWQVYKRLTKSFQPFKRTEFDDPRTQKTVKELIPELDLESEEVRQTLRALRVPNRLLEQLEFLGKRAKHKAREIDIPLLLLQGTEDKRVSRNSSKKLVQHYKGLWQYEEFVTGHDLVAEENDSWSAVSKAILNFAARVEQNSRF